MSKSTNSLFVMIVLMGFSYIHPTEGTTSSDTNALTFYGPANIKNTIKNQSLKVMGPLVLDNTDINGQIEVYGPFLGNNVNTLSLTVQGPADIQNLKVGEITINGPLSIKGSVVSGSATINGPIRSSNTVFRKDVSVAARSLTFKNSEIQNLTIRPSNPMIKKEQILYLKGKTIIHGNITFESGNGKIISSENVVIKGMIKGGVKE